MWHFDYSAHERFIAPARLKSENWRLIVGLLAVPVMSMVLFGMYQVSIMSGLVQMGYSPAAIDLASGGSPTAMLLLLSGFAIISASVFIVVGGLHGRALLSVFGPLDRCIAHFGRVAFILIGLAVLIAVLPPYGYGAPLVENLAPGLWAALLPLSLVAVFIQISAEEILFRGYMQQQLAARYASPLVWMLVPSVVFALGHYDPENAGENAIVLVVWAGIFGVLMADLTARSGSLGPALAVHFVNNASALLIVSIPDSLNGLALYHLPFGMEDTQTMRAWLKVDFVLIIVMWLAARLAIRR